MIFIFLYLATILSLSYSRKLADKKTLLFQIEQSNLFGATRFPQITSLILSVFELF